jgi:hypothetical protein
MNNITFDLDFTNYDTFPENTKKIVKPVFAEKQLHLGLPQYMSDRTEFSNTKLLPLYEKAFDILLDDIHSEVAHRPVVVAPTRAGKTWLLANYLWTMTKNRIGKLDWVYWTAPENAPLYSVREELSKFDDVVVFTSSEEALSFFINEELRLNKTPGGLPTKRVFIIKAFAGIGTELKNDALEKLLYYSKKNGLQGFTNSDESHYADRCSGLDASRKEKLLVQQIATGNAGGGNPTEVMPRFYELCHQYGVGGITTTATERRTQYNIHEKNGDDRVIYHVIESDVDPIDMTSFSKSLAGINIIRFGTREWKYPSERDQITSITKDRIKQDNLIFKSIEEKTGQKGVAGIWSRDRGKDRLGFYDNIRDFLIEDLIPDAWGGVDGFLVTSTSKFTGFYDTKHPRCDASGWVRAEHDYVMDMADDPDSNVRYALFMRRGTIGDLCDRLRWGLDLNPLTNSSGRSPIKSPNPKLTYRRLGKWGFNSIYKNIWGVSESLIQKYSRMKTPIDSSSLLKDVDKMIETGCSWEEIELFLLSNSYFLTVIEDERGYGREIGDVGEVFATYHTPLVGTTKKILASKYSLKP